MLVIPEEQHVVATRAASIYSSRVVQEGSRSANASHSRPGGLYAKGIGLDPSYCMLGYDLAATTTRL
jgi:hypothetical protein